MPATATDRLFGLTTSVAVKAPCRTVATANITLSGLQTISGVTLVEGDRVLVTAQTSSVNNGIYVASSGTWSRAADFDGARDAVKGTLVVTDGVSTALLFYRLTTVDPVVFGSSAITFEQASEVQNPYPRTQAEINASVVPVSYGYPELNLLRYGADPTGAVAANTAMSNAIAVCGTTGGTIIVPPGVYLFTGNSLVLNLSAKIGITIQGTGAETSGAQPAVRFNFSGTGTGVLISMNSALGCSIKGIQIRHTSASFTGTYIKCSKTTFDPQYCGVYDCTFGDSAGTGTTHLDLDNCINFTAERCLFSYGNPSVKGRTASSYSNVIRFRDCQWYLNYVAPIQDPGQAWIIEGGSFEPLTTGAPGGIRCTSVTIPAVGLSVIGCWFGDATATAGTWMDLQGAAISITGNFISGDAAGSTGIKLSQVDGFTITGNSFVVLLVGINCATTTCHGGVVQGNQFNTVTTQFANMANASIDLVFNPNYGLIAPDATHGVYATTGWSVDANGVIDQWGTFDMAAVGTQAVNFTKTFPSACWNVVVGFDGAFPGTNTVGAQSASTTGFTAAYSGTAGAASFYYRAKGN